jgi:hypothetical protein
MIAERRGDNSILYLRNELSMHLIHLIASSYGIRMHDERKLPAFHVRYPE